MRYIIAFFKSRIVHVLAVLLMATAAILFRHSWWPALNGQIERIVGRPTGETGHGHANTGHANTGHANTGHANTGHAQDSHEHGDAQIGPATESLELSDQAMKNLGLTAEYLQPIRTSNFYRKVSVPAVIVERQGRSVLQVSTPMTGVVTSVSAVPGASVEPGDPLFRIRLTHEELVSTQTNFVRALGELDVEIREINRLQGGVDSGVLPPKTLLERQYAKEKLEALLNALREALRLHGLSDRQVHQIEKERRLLSELNVTVPSREGKPGELQLSEGSRFLPAALVPETPSMGRIGLKVQLVPLIIESLDVQPGQAVEQGARLCSLADYSRLYIEGRAFEQHSEILALAAGQNWNITAVFSNGHSIADLPIAFVSSEIDVDARTLSFYVDLANEIVHDRTDADGNRFVSWKYKPGQRLQLLIPVEEWKDQVVLPVDSVAQAGPESFVFQQNGNRFNRIAVHVIHRDQTSVVIANDGSLFPGDVVALRNAHQMQMAIRNQSGAAVDPHAGHTH